MSTFFRAVQVWKEARANHSRLKTTALELLRHPDATEEQIMQVRKAYMDSHQRMTEMHQKLTGKFGNRVVGFDTPKE